MMTGQCFSLIDLKVILQMLIKEGGDQLGPIENQGILFIYLFIIYYFYIRTPSPHIGAFIYRFSASEESQGKNKKIKNKKMKK